MAEIGALANSGASLISSNISQAPATPTPTSPSDPARSDADLGLTTRRAQGEAPTQATQETVAITGRLSGEIRFQLAGLAPLGPPQNVGFEAFQATFSSLLVSFSGSAFARSGAILDQTA